MVDDREDHKSDPPTLWFVAPTNKGRPLKIVFIFREGKVFLRTAYDADTIAQSIYDAKGVNKELVMNKAVKRIESTDAAWEDGTLGCSMEHAAAAPADMERAIEESLGMQSISIRLPKNLIEAYKLIAAHHGVGYQPLMRDILQRFAPEGLREVMSHHTNKAEEVDHRLEEWRKAA